ncbi:MAG: cytochrome ubiquinol oxidase subunit I [Gemmatimonadaceae bacterium]
MSDLLAARSQMAMSLAFHIIFAVVGMGMPVLMVISEWRWYRTRDPVMLDLAKRWARGTAILFAVGRFPEPYCRSNLGCCGRRS